VVLAFAVPPGWANSVLPACQNLMLAARALGIGSVPTTLHPKVMERFYTTFGVPKDATFHFAIPLGYPDGPAFRPGRRRPTAETTYLDTWGTPPPWV
jgi:nitroreductase